MIVTWQDLFGAIAAPVRVMVEGLVRVTVPVCGPDPIASHMDDCEALLTCTPVGR